MDEAPQDSRMPRGVIAIVVVGLIACVAAALLSTDKGSGESASLEWIEHEPVADSKPVDVPGGTGSMQLIKGSIAATGTNVSGYSLYRVANTLRIDAGSPISHGKVLCATKAGPRTEIARSAEGLRALYPRSSESGIYTQNVPERLVMDFSARGGENVIVEAEDLGIRGFTTEKGVKLEWPKYTVGTERLEYSIEGGPPTRDLDLPFFSIWKTTTVPSAKVSCTVTTSAGEATVETKAALKKVTPPIDEEAEEHAEEEAQEREEEKEEAEEESDSEEEGG
ncbi:MAG TPA: hypothetical protein VMS11_03715 [Solirubrobacterales bacterium]|nr:hypothetical protein [Solirubrobacterales bacterium]